MEKSDQIITWSSEELLGLGHAKFYRCSFCKRGFSNAQALGGHMNIHRRDRARLREFSSDQNLLSLDINNSVHPLPSPRPPPTDDDDSLQREESLYDEAIICSPSKRPCVTYHEENDHPISKVNYDHNPPPRPPPVHEHVLLQQKVLSSYDETTISSPSKRPYFTYEDQKDHPTYKVNHDHDPPLPRPPPAPANDDLFQREVSSYDETKFSSSLKRRRVTYDEENDHLITSKVNYYDNNHEVIIGDFLQLPLFKETPLIKEASNSMDDGKIENKSMQLNPDSELDLELRLGMEPLESLTETDLQFELHKF